MSVRDEQLIRPVWPFALNHGSRQAQRLLVWLPMVHPGGEKIFDLSGAGRHGTITGGKWVAGSNGFPVWESTSVTANTNYVDLGTASWLPTADVSIALWYRKTDTTNRISSAFGIDALSSAGERCGVHLPYSNGIIYWDFGGTAGVNRLSVSGLSFAALSHWVFVAGSEGLRIYQNGQQVASSATGVTRTATGAFYLNQKSQGTTTGDLAQFGDFRIYSRQLSAADVRALYERSTRYELYYPLGRRLWFIPQSAVTPLSVSGTITPVGALTKQDNKALAGSASPSGAITKQANKDASGTITPSGSIAGLFAHALAGLITPSGAVAKLAGKLVAGTITPSGTLDALRTALLSLAGSLGLSGVLTRRASKGLSGTITAAGGLAKRLAKALSGAITAAGALVSSLSSSNQQIIVTLSDEAVTIASVSDDLGG